MTLTQLRTQLLTVVLGLLSGAASTLTAADKPNIIVIVGDDMGYADIGVHGCKDIPTPNIDKLAADGVRCSSGYVSGTYCSPTRAGLLTGRYPTRFGHEFNPGGGPKKASKSANKDAGLPLTEVTLADRLKKAGYNTALIGKWHLGYAEPFRPLHRGFDNYFGFLGGAHSYYPNKSKYPDDNAPIFRGDEVVQEDEYFTDAIGREAVAYLDRQTDKPFFLCVTFNAVHTPMQAPEERLAKFAGIADKKRRTYAAMMSAMDDAIGAILNKLYEKKLDENTLVFFFSDNGGPTIETTTVNGSINTPLRGSKRTTLEGGIRVPFLVKWPGHLLAGKVYDKPVIQLDIAPTVLTAAGVDPSGDKLLEGVNILPYLARKNDAAPHDALYWRFGNQMAIRKGDWKLVKYDPTVDGAKVPLNTAGKPHLYNLANDLGEIKDLIEEHPEKAQELQAAWDMWNKDNIPARWGMDGQPIRGKKDKARQPQAAARRRANVIPTGSCALNTRQFHDDPTTAASRRPFAPRASRRCRNPLCRHVDPPGRCGLGNPHCYGGLGRLRLDDALPRRDRRRAPAGRYQRGCQNQRHLSHAWRARYPSRLR